MKRMSKREMQFRFDLVGEAKVKIDRIERGHAVAVLEGVECRLDLGRSERRDIAHPGAVRARLSYYPKSMGDGSPAKGTQPAKDPCESMVAVFKERGVRLESLEVRREWDTKPYEEFARLHPVGTLVEADVVTVSRHGIRMQFAGGLQTRMSIGDYWDRWPYCRYEDRMQSYVPNRIEVIVRRVVPLRRFLNVTMHGYPQDGTYCNATAGYRSAYAAEQGDFRLLPWERGRSERQPVRRER